MRERIQGEAELAVERNTNRWIYARTGSPRRGDDFARPSLAASCDESTSHRRQATDILRCRQATSHCPSQMHFAHVAAASLFEGACRRSGSINPLLILGRPGTYGISLDLSMSWVTLHCSLFWAFGTGFDFGVRAILYAFFF